MKRIFAVAALVAVLATLGIEAAAQKNISRQEGTRIHVSLFGERGYGAGLAAGATWLYGNGFSLSAGLDGEWNQRPNNGNNFFAAAYGEAKYSFLKGSVSPFVAARLKGRFLIPSHLKEGTNTDGFSRVSSQIDLFGIGLAGLDFSRFALWGGIGGGPSLFTEESKDADLKVSKDSHHYLDLTYSFGLTYWF